MATADDIRAKVAKLEAQKSEMEEKKANISRTLAGKKEIYNETQGQVVNMEHSDDPQSVDQTHLYYMREKLDTLTEEISMLEMVLEDHLKEMKANENKYSAAQAELVAASA